MRVLNSTWLISMLDRAGSTPQVRLIRLFDILADWSQAPGVHEQLQQASLTDQEPELLLAYLIDQAKQAGFKSPESLAQQIVFMAQTTLLQSINTLNKQPFEHAKIVVNALIEAQNEGLSMQARYYAYGIATTVVAGLIALGVLVIPPMFNAPSVSVAALATASQNPQPLLKPTISTSESTSPQSTADMYAYLEKMRQGQCQYPEALQIPDAHKRVYIENVVGGEPAKTPQDRAIAEMYMSKVRCNFTPMLMKNSLN